MDVSVGVSLLCFSCISVTTASTVPGSCRDQCEAGRVGGCFCNSHCRRYGDCCHDYHLYCGTGQIEQQQRSQHTEGSCMRGCNSGRHGNCFCNSQCRRHGDCCQDYHGLCSNSTRHIGLPRRRQLQLPSFFGNASISEVARAMWRVDSGRVPRTAWQLDYQGFTSTRSNRDRAPRPLFAQMDEAFLNRTTYRLFSELLDNYNPDTSVTDVPTSRSLSEIQDFIDALVVTNPMILLKNYLSQREIITDTPEALKTLLRQLWFQPYRRGRGDRSSSGFEHVFVGETSRSSVSGFHNWLQFYLEERRGRLNYLGYVSKEEPWLIRAQFTWRGRQKRGGSILVGVSPEFELALYTLCMVLETDDHCDVTLFGQNLTLRTYDVKWEPGLQVASAFVTF